MLNPKGDLAAVQVAFFAPALCIALFVVFRHGFKRNLGWIYLVLLAILRIIGASCTLDMESQNNYSAGLLETAAITSAVGTAPLLLALMGFLERIHTGMEHKNLPAMAFRPLHLAALAGLVLAIIGGLGESHTSAGDIKTGKELMEAASIVFLAIYLTLAAIILWTIINVRWVLTAEKKLLQAGLLALPFLLVRLVYTVAVAFSAPGGVFYFSDVNVYAQAFMQFMMEAIVVSIFIFGGLLTPKMVRHELIESSKDVESVPIEDIPGQDSGRMPRPDQQQAPRTQARPQRSLGDYRPSKLIMSAIRDRQ
ncbi:hypothetical protein LTR36_009285 [Oleoguttula mirabilis]|uniref:DUF7702 domain-containing protein n=1 Tax=Oleoguttula mirabilis TaxID=1507867 RepID=A0AAV9J6C1_9PEZI|nr:hypothetical protein LTR36_009285 [Oleoguttula mirabilis]